MKSKQFLQTKFMKFLKPTEECNDCPIVVQPQRYALIFSIVIFCGVIVMVPNFALAVPGKEDCSQADVYERLACRQKGIAKQLEYTSDTVFDVGTKLHQRTKPARIKRINNAKDKAIRAEKKNTKEAFKRHAKAEVRGNQKGGHLIPLSDSDDFVDSDGNPGSDGICDYYQGDGYPSAQCAAIELDASGNLQACNPKKKNKGQSKGGGNPKFEGLECDMFFESEDASTDIEDEDMKEAAEQLDATYSTTEDDLIDMNEQLEIVNTNLPSETASIFTNDNSCILPELTPGLAEARVILRDIHASVFGSARMMADAGGQTVVAFGFGGNSRSFAIAFDAIAAVANLAYIAVDEIHKAESGELQMAISTCVQQSAGDIANLQSQILSLQALIQNEHKQIMNNDDNNRDLVMTNLEMVKDELIKILNKPLGQRSEFPIISE